jgi:hypothetical protein
MMHLTRKWHVGEETHPATPAVKLTEHIWTTCTGFRCNGYLWLNDATSENGAQEYAVVLESDGRQVESVSASWCTADRLLEIIRGIEAGEHEAFGTWRLDREQLLPLGRKCGRCI